MTVVGATMRINGSLISHDELLINGQVQGKIETQGRITIGPDSKVEATIKAKEVIVAGSITGNVDAGERLLLRAGANLVGDVKTAGIVIEDGAYFKGGIDIARPVPASAATA